MWAEILRTHPLSLSLVKMSKLIYKLKRTLRRLPSRTPLNEVSYRLTRLWSLSRLSITNSQSRYDEIPNLLSELESGSIESTTRPIECTESNTTEGDIADRNSTESNITNTPGKNAISSLLLGTRALCPISFVRWSRSLDSPVSAPVMTLSLEDKVDLSIHTLPSSRAKNWSKTGVNNMYFCSNIFLLHLLGHPIIRRCL